MDAVEAIEQAVIRGVLIEFVYGERSHRVEPYRLRVEGGCLLFHGWCLTCECLEPFEPQQMYDVEITDEPYWARFPIEM